MSRRNPRRTVEKKGRGPALTELPYHRRKHHIPNSWENRPSADAFRAKAEGPPYTLDAESLCQSDSLGQRPNLNPILATIWLTDKLADPDFHLEYTCRTCETWVATRLNRPARQGAPDPTDSCFGCIYGHINGHDVDFATVDRDEAFSRWAAAKSQVRDLEVKRATCTSPEQKAKMQTRLDQAYERLKRTVDVCKGRGFVPGTALKPRHEIAPEALDEFAEVVEQRLHDPSYSSYPSCSTCTSWTEDERLSEGKSEPRGYCWVRDGEHTKASYGCPEYRQMPL